MRNFLAAMLITVAANGFAESGGVGNGGGAFVCIDGQEIRSAISQDIWEANVRYQYEMTSVTNEEEGSFGAVERIKEHSTLFYQLVRAELENVLKKRRIGPFKILPTGDDLREFEMDRCERGGPQFAQAAKYIDESEEILFSEKIWEKMDALSKAALNVHEAVYRVLRREFGQDDSRASRRITGILFSKDLEEHLSTLMGYMPGNHYQVLSTMTYQENLYRLKKIFDDGRKPKRDEIEGSDWNCVYMGENNRPKVEDLQRVPRVPVYFRRSNKRQVYTSSPISHTADTLKYYFAKQGLYDPALITNVGNYGHFFWQSLNDGDFSVYKDYSFRSRMDLRLKGDNELIMKFAKIYRDRCVEKTGARCSKTETYHSTFAYGHCLKSEEKK